MGSFWQFANAVSPLNACKDGTKGFVSRFSVRSMIHDDVNHPSKWHLRGRHRIGNWGFAAASVPAEHAFVREAQTLQMLDSQSDLQLARSHGKDIGSTIFIENVLGTTQVVGIGLAVITEADDAFASRTGNANGSSSESPTAAFERNIVGHVSPDLRSKSNQLIKAFSPTFMESHFLMLLSAFPILMHNDGLIFGPFAMRLDQDDGGEWQAST